MCPIWFREIIMSKQETKTNVMRILEQNGIEYIPHEYPHPDGAMSGVDVAALIGEDADKVFKTLVARGSSKNLYVFVIPVAATLELKKAAKAVGEKSIEMIKQAELLPNTGYIHGGCSPIGMKKHYRTTIAEEVILVDSIIVSAGKIGFQVELKPENLIVATDATVADVTQ